VRLAAAAVLVVVAGIAAAATFGGGGDDRRAGTVALSGAGGAHGSATLTARAWGTEVHVELEGLVAGEVYWLWVADADGDRVAAGSLRGTGRRSTAVLAAGMDAAEAARVWVTDERDGIVLDGWTH
jgi:hypothetical protein